MRTFLFSIVAPMICTVSPGQDITNVLLDLDSLAETLQQLDVLYYIQTITGLQGLGLIKAQLVFQLGHDPLKILIQPNPGNISHPADTLAKTHPPYVYTWGLVVLSAFGAYQKTDPGRNT